MDIYNRLDSMLKGNIKDIDGSLNIKSVRHKINSFSPDHLDKPKWVAKNSDGSDVYCVNCGAKLTREGYGSYAHYIPDVGYLGSACCMSNKTGQDVIKIGDGWKLRNVHSFRTIQESL